MPLSRHRWAQLYRLPFVALFPHFYSIEQQVSAFNRSSTPTDDNGEIDIDLLSDEEDSLTHLEHMQENSLNAHFNVGTDGEEQTRKDNQEESSVGPATAITQEGNLITLKTEPPTEEVIVKVEPGTRSQVITVEFFRRFLEAG